MSDRSEHREPWTSAIDVRIRRELAMMQESLGSHADRDTLLALHQWTHSTLVRIGKLLAGGDHYHRFAPLTRNPDTIERLEAGIRARLHGFDPRIHKLSAVFIHRGDRSEPIDSSLDIRWIDGLPLQTSSTLIRDALGGHEPPP